MNGFSYWQRERIRCLPHFFSYFGSKWREAHSYPKPKYKTIIEPFAGSAGYSSYWADHDIILYDLNPKICGVWEFLIRSSEKDILALPLITEGRGEDIPNICQEAQWLISFWCQPATPNGGVLSSWSKDPRKETSVNSWSRLTKLRISKTIQYIKHWKIFNKSYLDIPNVKATWHIDPPYIRAGKAYPFRIDDYEKLGRWCRTRHGQVMVCEQEGADWLPFRKFKVFKTHLVNANPGQSKSHEVIWTNET